ncbi:MAG: NFACT RNA binding domain-containing protein [Anaerolineae bacterium]
MARYYSTPEGEDAYNAGKNLVRVEMDEIKARLSARLASLQRSMTDDSEREVLRQSGELILAYQYALQPGQTELKAQYDPDQPELIIKIDLDMSALENAQRYFDKYNRAKRALDDVPRLIEETEGELALVAQLDTDLNLAANWGEIDEVQQTLQAAGLWRGKPSAKIAGGNKSARLRFVLPDGMVIWVGRNSRQNEIVTFDKASPNDTWLHAHGVAGSHVVIKNEGRRIPDDVIEKAAALAAYYSASRGEGRVVVDVTERRHVRKIKGAAAGMVTYRNEVTRTVEPRSEQDLGLK